MQYVTSECSTLLDDVTKGLMQKPFCILLLNPYYVSGHVSFTKCSLKSKKGFFLTAKLQILFSEISKQISSNSRDIRAPKQSGNRNTAANDVSSEQKCTWKEIKTESFDMK